MTQFIAFLACLLVWVGSGSVTFSPSQTEWISILALGTLTPLAYYSFTSCLRVMPKFSIVSQYLEPVFGVLIGISLFGEVLTLPQVAGSILIIAGSVAIEQ